MFFSKTIKNKLKNIEITSVKKSRFSKIFCFKSARAKYTEVLLSQREALQSKQKWLKAKETNLQQMLPSTNRQVEVGNKI